MTAGLEHKAAEATTRVGSDLGKFAAVAAVFDNVDRERDRIRFGAFAKTIERWQASARNLPLHWHHSADAKNIIGYVDPSSMREIAGLGLYVEGKLDIHDSGVAAEAWRSMKNGVVALSFGYLTLRSRGRDGIRELLELDLFEISLTPTTANPQTRILKMKSAALAEREQADLRRRCDELALEMALGSEPMPKPAPAPVAKSVPTTAELRQRAAKLGVALPPSYLETVRAEARDHIIACLRGADEQAGHR